jgi:nicotinamidase/pyrazinamidase
MEIKKALLIIDVQKDFCEGGVLPAQDTVSLIKPLNEIINYSITHRIICVYTRDWHPFNHCSFIDQGGPWPKHCVQGTLGAEFANGLIVQNSGLVIDIEKDTNKANMSYSAFEDTILEIELKAAGVTEIAVSGIATDYCVNATVLDALKCNFVVKVLIDLIRPINNHPDDSIKALEEMKKSGAFLMKSIDWMI